MDKKLFIILTLFVILSKVSSRTLTKRQSKVPPHADYSHLYLTPEQIQENREKLQEQHLPDVDDIDDDDDDSMEHDEYSRSVRHLYENKKLRMTFLNKNDFDY